VNAGSDLFRARITNRAQSLESGLGQARLRSGDTPEQDSALVVGYWSDRVDEFRARFLAQVADQKRANLGSPHAPESASGCLSHLRMHIIEKIAQQGNRFGPRARAPAGIRSNLRIVMPQQLRCHARR